MACLLACLLACLRAWLQLRVPFCKCSSLGEYLDRKQRTIKVVCIFSHAYLLALNTLKAVMVAAKVFDTMAHVPSSSNNCNDLSCKDSLPTCPGRSNPANAAALMQTLHQRGLAGNTQCSPKVTKLFHLDICACTWKESLGGGPSKSRGVGSSCHLTPCVGAQLKHCTAYEVLLLQLVNTYNPTCKWHQVTA